ncbi:hypothetical protein M441DRAFT_380567 [Trichoderma asperellum CBS 433.97]|uniref:Secreted protein n=1 Tax=Trichoderma asperellum (strain ATCC 204424 / CBS 433.97 / NBRC 101777) TaxID=1042311 RepID=A0A2T3ZB02_TRIA4|nr:hypothetical protein M441DRAFT_380567 [Trichoderma asperellum CBS 433.97]PTB41989.1 hypothetical protein M441DRAFT_380567 [Trichoderma asperellum CBS 433.97]
MTLPLLLVLACSGAFSWIHLGVHLLHQLSRFQAAVQGQRWSGCENAAAHSIFRGLTVAPNLTSPAWDPEKSADPSGVHAGSTAVLEHIHESPPIAAGAKRKEGKLC